MVNQTGEVMPDKYQSFMRGMMRSTAQAMGRDPEIAENLLSEPLWLCKSLVLRRKFDLSYCKAFVVTVELVHLVCVLAGLNEIACLVDHAWLTDLEEFLYLCYRDFLFPLETACTALRADALDGDESFLTLYAYAYGALRN